MQSHSLPLFLHSQLKQVIILFKLLHSYSLSLYFDPSDDEEISCCCLLIGRLNANVAPFPSLLFSAHILPPRDSTILFEIYNPSPIPVPFSDFVANFVKSFGNI